MASFVGPLVSCLVLLLLSVSTARADPNAPCYSPQGKRIDGFYPCDPSAFVTMCCPQGWTCFSDSLCVVTTQTHAFPNLTLGQVQRGGCTNPQWNNNICGPNCLTDTNTAGDMLACGGDKFCCGGDYQAGSCNCSSTGNNFPVSVGLPLTIVGVSDASFTGSPSYLTVLPSRTSTHEATTTGNGTSSARPTTSGTPTNTSSGPGNTTDTTSPTPTDSGSGNGNVALKAGIGAGVAGAVLIAAAVLVYFFWWRPRQNNRLYAYGGDRDAAGEGYRINRGVNQGWDANYGRSSADGADSSRPAMAPVDNPYDNRRPAPVGTEAT